MRPVFDIIALRSLVAVADEGGFRRAAESLTLSQSAVSQHVRRLEKTLGRPVVERAGRATRFTAAGKLLLDEARWILSVHDEAARRLLGSEPATVVIGSAEHAADQILPMVTEAVHRTLPRSQVRFRIDRSARLVEAVNRRSVDLAVYVTEAVVVEGMPVGGLPLKWYAAPGWTPPPAPAALPLAAIEEPCAVRRQALQVLSAHDIPASVVCDAGYLAGVLEAARAGLGVALLAATGRGYDGLVEYTGLPQPPAIRMSAHARPGADPTMVMNAVEAVRSLLEELAVSRPTAGPDTADALDTPCGDLSDDEWKSVEPLLPLGERGPYPEGLRRQFDGVLWRFRTGSPWRTVPERYGAWQTVHHRFQQWALAGTFQTLSGTAGTTVPHPHWPATLLKAAEEERRLRARDGTGPGLLPDDGHL
ncbi:transposase [Streptomyces sp. NPDC003247]|uniref:transposase n=1 Tax=Streptomyces sp. NPDC003247 TaxID=3364677 RepID=UPI0036BD4DC1